MFQFTSDYAARLFAQPAGMVEYAASFLVQYFAKAYVGVFCTVALYVLTALSLRSLLKHVSARGTGHPLLYLLPGFAYIWAGFNEICHLEAGLAFLLVVALFALYVKLGRCWLRLLFAYLVSWIAYWMAGPMAFLFSAVVLVEEVLRTDNTGRQKCCFLPLAIWCVLPPLGYYFCGASSLPLRGLMTASAYCHPLLEPPTLLWIAPCWVVVAVVLSHLLKMAKGLENAVARDFVAGVELLIVAVVFWRGCNFYHNPDDYMMKQLDYYAGNGQWESILETPGLSPSGNALLACYQNLALAQTGRLADHLFDVEQCGPRGLWPKWNRMAPVSGLLSRVAYAMGNVALAQALAFEGIMGSERACNPRYLLILVKTNLINGQYTVAEKYITKLERTACYADEASRLRHFLYNDKAVLADGELGKLRRTTKKLSGLTNEDRAVIDIWPILQSCPQNRAAAEYYGALCLMMKDLKHFEELATLWHKTYADSPMPRPFQQALAVIHESEDENTLRSLGVSRETSEEFVQFKNALRAYAANPGNSANLQRYFSHTFWYYYTFYNLQK